MLSGGVDEPTDVGRVVREVAVHLEDQLGAVLERAAEAGEVRGAEALLARAVQDGHAVELGGERVRDVSGAVGRVVVDHEHAHAEAVQRANHALDVLALVVGGEADGGAQGAAYHRRDGDDDAAEL